MVGRKLNTQNRFGNATRKCEMSVSSALRIERISLHLRAFHVENFLSSDDQLQVRIIDPRAGGAPFQITRWYLSNARASTD